MAELHLLLAGAERVGHLVDAGVLPEPLLDDLGRRPQAVEVGAGALMMFSEKSTATASGMGPVASRHRSPSSSLP